MKFKLSIAGDGYTYEKKVDLEKLGFIFKEGDDTFYYIKNDDNAFVEIKTIKGLMDFVNRWRRIIIIRGSIKIYDDWIE